MFEVKAGKTFFFFCLRQRHGRHLFHVAKKTKIVMIKFMFYNVTILSRLFLMQNRHQQLYIALNGTYLMDNKNEFNTYSGRRVIQVNEGYISLQDTYLSLSLVLATMDAGHLISHDSTKKARSSACLDLLFPVSWR